MTVDIHANNDDASVADSKSSSVPDILMVNSNPARSKYGYTYRRTTCYDPATGHTIGAEATALANYYHCFKEMDGEMEFANLGAGIGGVIENTMELKPMKYKEANNGPDGET